MRIVRGWVGQVNSISEGKPCFSGAVAGFCRALILVISRLFCGYVLSFSSRFDWGFDEGQIGIDCPVELEGVAAMGGSCPLRRMGWFIFLFDVLGAGFRYFFGALG